MRLLQNTHAVKWFGVSSVNVCAGHCQNRPGAANSRLRHGCDDAGDSVEVVGRFSSNCHRPALGALVKQHVHGVLRGWSAITPAGGEQRENQEGGIACEGVFHGVKFIARKAAPRQKLGGHKWP